MSWEDEDWENPAAEPAAAAAVGGGEWDDEDQDEDLLAGDEWDADPEEAAEKAGAPVVPGKARLTKRQLAKKKEEEERKMKEEKMAMENMSEEELAKLKEAERKRMEKDQLRNASDLFGDMGDLNIDLDQGDEDHAVNEDNSDMASVLDPEQIKKMQEQLKEKAPGSIQDWALKTKDDFNKLAKEVGGHAAKSVNPKMRGDTEKLVEFLKILITDVTEPMTLDECNEVKKHFNAIYNNKAKDPSKKKPKKGKKTLKMGNSDAFDDMGGGGGYDEFDW